MEPVVEGRLAWVEWSWGNDKCVGDCLGARLPFLPDVFIDNAEVAVVAPYELSILPVFVSWSHCALHKICIPSVSDPVIELGPLNPLAPL
jgi:hypothetical protein